MNVFLNEHWEDLWRDLKPSVQETMQVVFKTYLTAVADLVPFEYLFPDK